MKYFSIFLFLIISFTCSFSQDSTAVSAKRNKNSFYLEGLGNINLGFVSLNYERAILESKQKKDLLNVRIGGMFPLFENTIRALLMLNYVHGKTHCIEIGGGLNYNKDLFYTHISDPKSTNSYDLIKLQSFVPTFNLNYRYQSQKSPFLFRFGYTPSFYPNWYKMDDLAQTGCVLFFGMSLGFTF